MLDAWVAIFATRIYESEDSMPKRTRPTVAQFITAKVKECGKSQIEIAEACGWPKPNIVSMLKSGATKLPLDKVGPLAKVLEVEPVYLFWLTMSEYNQDTLLEIEHAIRGVMLSDHEKLIIETYRRLTNGQDEDVTLHVGGDEGQAKKSGTQILLRRVSMGKNQVGLAVAA